MSDEERKRSKSRVLRFAVTSALLVGPASGCGSEPVEPVEHNAPYPGSVHPGDEESPDGPQLPDTDVEPRPEQERPTNAPAQETPPSDESSTGGITAVRGTNAPAPRTPAPDPVEGE